MAETPPPAGDTASGRPITFGIIGAGGIASKLHLPQLAGVPGARVKRLSGRTPARLETLARRFGVPHWSRDHQDILADPEIDAVVIALPHPLHVPVGLEALSAGKARPDAEASATRWRAPTASWTRRRPAGAPCSACRTSRAPSTPPATRSPEGPSGPSPGPTPAAATGPRGVLRRGAGRLRGDV